MAGCQPHGLLTQTHHAKKVGDNMSASVTIPIAGFKDVYDVPSVEKALQELSPTANEALRALYEKMLRLGGQRFTVKPSALPEMETLFEELPNFGEALEDIRKHLALCIDSDDSIELPPMLLLGEPGIGKTHFARKIAQLLGTGFGFVPMSSLTAGWVLSGASSQWKNAKPGKVFDTFLNGDYANPVIVVDELDKASSDGQYDPLGALYELLEVETSTRFVDEFVELPIDASGALWLATANVRRASPTPCSTVSASTKSRRRTRPARSHRRYHLPRDPQHARLGAAVPRVALAIGPGEAGVAAAARDAAHGPLGIWQREARRARRNRPG